MSLRSPLSDGYEVDVQDVLAHSAPSSSPRLPPPPPPVRSPIPIDCPDPNMSRVMCLALALASLTVPRGLQRFKHHMADLRHWLQKKRKFNHPRLLA